MTSQALQIEKCLFPPLVLDGSNYMTWMVHVEGHLTAKDILHTISDNFNDAENSNTRKKGAEAFIFILHHLDLSLQNQYFSIKNPSTLWKQLKARFDHQRTVLGPNTLHEWNQLRFQDFKTVAEYNSSLFGIVSKLKFCGHDNLVQEANLINKTLTTFHPSNFNLSEQYRNRDFKTYAELLSALLVAEQHHQVLLKNDKLHPVSQPAAPLQFKDLTHVESNYSRRQHRHQHPYAQSQGRGRGGRNQQRKQYPTSNQVKPMHHQSKSSQDKPSSNSCLRCGLRGHWANTCRTSKFHVDLYQKYGKQGRDTKPEANMVVESSTISPSIPILEYSFMDHPLEFEPEANMFEAHMIDLHTSRFLCLIDCASTHTILCHKEFFHHIKDQAPFDIKTIAGSCIGQGRGPASIQLPSGVCLEIHDAIYAPTSLRNLLAFADVRRNGYHLMTWEQDGKETMRVVKHLSNTTQVIDELEVLPNQLYCFNLKAPKIRMASFAHYSNISSNVNTDIMDLWHDRLGHPGHTMIRRMINNVQDLPLKLEYLNRVKTRFCVPCAQGKLVIRPSLHKELYESPIFLERIHGDIHGPVHPPSGPFYYFMGVKDASSRFSHVTLLSTRNMALPRLLILIIKLRAQFPDFPIKSIRMDNAAEFTSTTFIRYCESIGINFEVSTPHVHTQNGMAESLIKQIQVIVRPILLKSNLPSSTWGHAVLHASQLLRLWPSSYHVYSPHQLMTGFPPFVSHLQIFGCAVYVPIYPHYRRKLGPQRHLGIYVGFNSPSIIRYLEPTTGDLFTTRFADCQFDESTFPILGEDN